MDEELFVLVCDAIGAINEDLNVEALRRPEEETPLFELLDSMAVLDLILELEERLRERYGRYIQVASEEAMDAVKTPFATVGSTVEYLRESVRDGETAL